MGKAIGKTITTCGHEIKKVMWEVVIMDFDDLGFQGRSFLSVCPKCYHARYKKLAVFKGIRNIWG